jgi:FixJ family two-component response regulator
MYGKPRIAVVDDDESVRQGLANLISSVGYEAELYASAEELLACPEAGEAACLVLDLRMPGMSGLELQRRLAAHSGGPPVIIITAHGDDEARAEALAAGAVAFLNKPFKEETLLGAISSALSLDRRE